MRRRSWLDDQRIVGAVLNEWEPKASCSDNVRIYIPDLSPTARSKQLMFLVEDYTNKQAPRHVPVRLLASSALAIGAHPIAR